MRHTDERSQNNVLDLPFHSAVEATQGSCCHRYYTLILALSRYIYNALSSDLKTLNIKDKKSFGRSEMPQRTDNSDDIAKI